MRAGGGAVVAYYCAGCGSKLAERSPWDKSRFTPPPRPADVVVRLGGRCPVCGRILQPRLARVSVSRGCGGGGGVAVADGLR